MWRVPWMNRHLLSFWKMDRGHPVETAAGRVEEREECCGNRARKGAGKWYRHPRCHQTSRRRVAVTTGCPHYVLSVSTSLRFLLKHPEKSVRALVSTHTKHPAWCSEQFSQQSRRRLSLESKISKKQINASTAKLFSGIHLISCLVYCSQFLTHSPAYYSLPLSCEWDYSIARDSTKLVGMVPGLNFNASHTLLWWYQEYRPPEKPFYTKW